MNLLTAKEIQKFEEAGISVSLDTTSGYGRQTFTYTPKPGKQIVAFRGYKPLLGEFSDEIIANASTIEFVPVINGKPVGRFTARIGSYSNGKRWFAGLFRKYALLRATRKLHA